MKQFVRLILHQQSKYLLIKEVKGNYYNAWNFPGGKIEATETAEEAIVREIKEELNLKLLNPQLVLEVDCSFNQEPWHGYYFSVPTVDLTTLKIMETDKCDGYCFFTLAELQTLPLGIPASVLEQLR